MADETPNPTNNANRSVARGNEGGEQPSNESTSSCSEVHEPEASKTQTNSEKTYKHWLDYATGFFAFIAAFAAILAAIFSGWQASVASDTERRQLRAYVGVDVPVINVSEGTVVFELVNAGQTPASKVNGTLQSARLLSGNLLAPDFTFPEGPSDLDIYNSFGQIPPQKTQKRTVTLQPGEVELIKQAIRGGQPYIFYGHFDYFDIFDKPHSCTYAYYLFKGERMVQVDRHNDCD